MCIFIDFSCNTVPVHMKQHQLKYEVKWMKVEPN